MPTPTESGSTNITVTLPDATSAYWFTSATSGAPGQSRVLRLKRRDTNSSGTVTLIPRVSGQKIDNATSKTMATLQAVGVVSDGANLWLV